MAHDAYRSELEAAQARIATLEEELGLRRRDARAVRLAALARERETLATLAMPHLTRAQTVLSTVTFVAFLTVAVGAAMAGQWPLAGLFTLIAIGVRVFFVRTAQARAANFARKLETIDLQILALESPSAPASDEHAT